MESRETTRVVSMSGFLYVSLSANVATPVLSTGAKFDTTTSSTTKWFAVVLLILVTKNLFPFLGICSTLWTRLW